MRQSYQFAGSNALNISTSLPLPLLFL